MKMNVKMPQEFHDAVIGDLFSNKLAVSVSSSERMHRLGKNNSNRTRPVIVNCFNYNDKIAVQRNCRILKGSPLSVSEDFSEQIRVIRKKLWDSSADDRARGDKVTLVYDKIRIETPCTPGMNSAVLGGCCPTKAV